MKTLMKSVVIFALAVSAQVGFSAEELSVLYWMVNDPDVYGVGGGNTAVKVRDLQTPEGAELGARVKVTGEHSGYLGLVDSNYQTTPIDDYGIATAPTMLWVDTSGTGPVYAGPAMSRVSDALLTDDYLFTMELGYYDGNGEWFSVAMSSSIDGGTLMDKFVSTEDMMVPGHLDWRPDAHVFDVPEPSSGMLVLLGCALMGLRRKRRGACAV